MINHPISALALLLCLFTCFAAGAEREVQRWQVTDLTFSNQNFEGDPFAVMEEREEP